MRKTCLLVILLNLIFIAWCSSKQSEPIHQYNEMMEIYEEEWKMTCDISTTSDTDWTLYATLYVDGNSSYINEYMVKWNISSSMYFLAVNWKTYARWDSYWDWKGIIIEKDITADLLKSLQPNNDSSKYKCRPGIQWYTFEIPSNINFTSSN